jgi:hypothetical protein
MLVHGNETGTTLWVHLLCSTDVIDSFSIGCSIKCTLQHGSVITTH